MEDSVESENSIVVDMEDVLLYIGQCPQMIKEAKLVRVADHIVFVGLSAYTDIKHFHVVAGVIRSSNPNMPPHEIKMNFVKDYADWVFNCSCKAGSGRCKHIGAILFHLMGYVN